MICTLWPVLLSAPAARAGTWQLSVSGSGSAHGVANGATVHPMTWTAPGPATGGITLPSVGSGASWQTVNTQVPVSATASLSATVTGTWVPDPSLASDPAPASVTLTEQSTATGTQTVTNSTGAAVQSAGQADDGLGLGDPQDPTTGKVSGTKYSAPAVSGGTFTVSVSLSASSGGTSGPDGFDDDGDYFTGSASCSASVGAVTISTIIPIVNLTGTTVDTSDGSQNILIGQHCASSLSGIPSGSGWSVTYQWSVSGTTFQTWSSDTPAIGSSPYNPDASYYVDGPGPLTNAMAGWYWNDLNKTTETVSCTASVTPPAGQGAAFTVTATKQVIVWVPKLNAGGVGTSMALNPHAENSGVDYLLQAGDGGTSGTGGMNFYGQVSSPSPTIFGDGSLVLVQLIIPGLSYDSPPIYPAVTSHWVYSLNGEEGLDTDYPFATNTGAPNYTWSDSPYLDLTATYATDAVLADQFEDYMMYFAPGSSQCVSLAHFVWTTNGNVSIPSSNSWADFGSASAGTVSPAAATLFLLGNSFPMWTQNNAEGNGEFVPN